MMMRAGRRDPWRRMLIAPLLWFIHAYQFVLSPLLGPHCRYLPTCSEYARDALITHGLLRGAGLALRRLLRCHPLGASGYDPVPSARAPDSQHTGSGQP